MTSDPTDKEEYEVILMLSAAICVFVDENGTWNAEVTRKEEPGISRHFENSSKNALMKQVERWIAGIDSGARMRPKRTETGTRP